jgi:hypothetical protein
VVKNELGETRTLTTTLTVIPPPGLLAAAPDFADDWTADRGMQDALGFATAPARNKPDDRSNPPAAEERFQNGYMFWFRADYDGATRIYALYNNDHGWASFPDTWREGVDPDFPCTKPPNPPQRGFAKVWCFQPGVKDKLGGQAGTEIGEGQLAQDFENGMMLRSLDYARTYILFKDGTWR